VRVIPPAPEGGPREFFVQPDNDQPQAARPRPEGDAEFPFGAGAPADCGRADGAVPPAAVSPTDSGPAAPDPFDPASLRLTQDFSATLGVKKALLAVPVRKPDRSWFVRVHPEESYRLQTAVIELKENRETYLVAPALWPALAAEATFSPRVLFTAVNRQGVVFLWPVRLPGPDGKVDEWSRTALEAARCSMCHWTRVVANLSLGGYDVRQATGQLPEPEWPDLPLRELLRIAFKDRFITALDHPVLRQLRGEV
jgi:hypothetical protein